MVFRSTAHVSCRNIAITLIIRSVSEIALWLSEKVQFRVEIGFCRASWRKSFLSIFLRWTFSIATPDCAQFLSSGGQARKYDIALPAN